MKIDPVIKEELKQFVVEKLKRQNERLVIVSASKLSNADLVTVRKNLGLSPKAAIEQRVDEELLGGIILTVGTKMIDLSIRGQLQKFHREMYEIT